ncbi:hypothetical protein ACSS6W_003633 [Trichoderma asperelloides]
MTRHRHRGSANRSTTYHPDQSGYSAVPSPVANDGCLSSRADFIPSWLHHMQACHNDPPQDIPQQKRPIDSTNLSWHPNGLTTVRIQPSCDTGRYQSSDNFIQGSPSQSSLPDQRCHHQYRQSALDSDHGQNLDDRERHHHSIQPTSTTSETSLTRNNVFEKQPRRKTRRDRYDTVKSKAERTEGGHRKKPWTRVTKKGRLRSSRERAAENISYGTASADHQLRPRQGESSNSRAEIHMSSAYLETSVPEVSGKCQPEHFRFKASGVEDVIHPRDNIPPMPYFNGTSSRYSIDWPAKPTVAKQIYQPHQEAFQELIQELNTVSRKSLEIVDDIPGETLKEYIERMEREILGQSELSAPCTDEAMPPSEANIFDNGRRPIKCLRRIEYNDDLPRRDQPHEAVHSFSRRYPRPYHAEESPAESESAFFWRPNHMMWC